MIQAILFSLALAEPTAQRRMWGNLGSWNEGTVDTWGDQTSHGLEKSNPWGTEFHTGGTWHKGKATTEQWGRPGGAFGTTDTLRDDRRTKDRWSKKDIWGGSVTGHGDTQEWVDNKSTESFNGGVHSKNHKEAMGDSFNHHEHVTNPDGSWTKTWKSGETSQSTERWSTTWRRRIADRLAQAVGVEDVEPSSGDFGDSRRRADMAGLPDRADELKAPAAEDAGGLVQAERRRMWNFGCHPLNKYGFPDDSRHYMYEHFPESYPLRDGKYYKQFDIFRTYTEANGGLGDVYCQCYAGTCKWEAANPRDAKSWYAGTSAKHHLYFWPAKGSGRRRAANEMLEPDTATGL